MRRVSSLIFHGFWYFSVLAVHIPSVSSFCEFQTVGSNIPHTVCLYDVFAMYNEEQCRLRSISCATYKVIVPSGPHLAKCRLCWAMFSIPATLVSTKHSSKNNTLQLYCTLICIYMVRTSRICWAYQLAFIKASCPLFTQWDHTVVSAAPF